MWVVEELNKYQLDLSKIPLGIIPFGTGNDFSRVLLWGATTSPSSLIGPYMKNFKELVQKWIFAEIRDFDIWEVFIECETAGKFLKIEKKDTWKKVPLQEKKMHKKMCNYFSFGVDSRIGYGFDKHRTKYVCGNKCVYCWEGFKKMFIST